MTNFSRVFVLVFVFVAMSVFVNAQSSKLGKNQKYSSKMDNFRMKKKDFRKNRYLSIGGSLHFLSYFGDLTPASNLLSTDINQIKMGISALVLYRYGPRMSIKGELMYGRLAGDDFTSADPADPADIGRYIRNLSFRNDIIDLSIMPQVYVFRNFLDYRERKVFNIYFNGGISVFYHNPKAKVPEYKLTGERFADFGEWVALRKLGTEGQTSGQYGSPYSQFQFSIPVGGGFNFKLNERFDFNLEINYRFLLTDYIDDVSGTYVDLGALDSDLAKALSDRSQEEYALSANKVRDMEFVFSNTTPNTYISKFDGNRYNVLSGYGSEGGGRGGAGNDTYLAISFKIIYVLKKTRNNNY